MLAHTWDEIENAILLSAANVLGTRMAQHVKKLESKTIDEVVYKVYTPKRYARRGVLGGGLADANNMISRVSINNDTVTLHVENKTPAKPGKKYSYSELNLPGLVEYGNGWDGNYYHYYNPLYDFNGRYARPRPFNRTTQEKIDNNSFSTLQVFAASLDAEINKL